MSSLPNDRTVPLGATFRRHATLLMALLIAGVAFAVFHYAPQCGFISFDDEPFVYMNPYVEQGFTWASLRWMFTSHLTEFSHYAEYWSPLTLASRLLDTEIHGVRNASGFHITSVVLHGINALVLFCAIRSLTGSVGRSACVALVFLVHPQNVEPVLWLSARKDLMCALFSFLSLWAYGVWVRDRTWKNYAVLLLAFLAGAMAKPMMVAIPLVMLLLDFWPLERKGTPIKALILEKLPFFAIAFGAAVLAAIGQARWNAISSTGALPIDSRIANACIAYSTYLRRVFFPYDEAILYPHPGESVNRILALALCVLLCLALFLAWRHRARFPWWLVGLSWCLVTLLPVIGLVQIGQQSMADRYAYTSLIGVLIAIIWQVEWLVQKVPLLRRWVPVAFGCVIIGFGAVASVYSRTWKDSESVFRNAYLKTRNNHIAMVNLAISLAEKGDYAAAMPFLESAYKLRPTDTFVLKNYGYNLMHTGDNDAALRLYGRALMMKPNQPDVQYLVGVLLVKTGRGQSAIRHFGAALMENDPLVDARVLEFIQILLKGPNKAMGHLILDEAIRQRPSHGEFLKLLEANPPPSP